MVTGSRSRILVLLAVVALTAACATPPARSSTAPTPAPGSLEQASSETGERFAILTAVRMRESEIVLAGDYVEVLRGAEASAAAAARDPLFSNVRGYLVVNDEHGIVTLPLSKDARVRCLAGEGPALKDLSPAAFFERWMDADASDGLRREPYRLELAEGRVMLLEQQYLR